MSFEPLSSAHSILEKTASGDAKWKVHPRTAVGARNGEIDFNVALNSVSSSNLPITKAHLSADAKSAYIATERVPIVMFDTVAPQYLNGHRGLLKIDTQGYEWEVLSGAQMTLPHVQGIYCELSLVEMYKGQLLWMDMVNRLSERGFALWSIDRGFTDNLNGRTLQVDAAFFQVQ